MPRSITYTTETNPAAATQAGRFFCPQRDGYAATDSALGRGLIDRGTAELRKVITTEDTPGQLTIRVQLHDDRSDMAAVQARILG